MNSRQEEKYFLQMSGEYGVCSELHKRNIAASITYGNYKSADIIIIKDKKAFHIEVKTTNKNNVVTGFFQNYPDSARPTPDFWVLVHIGTIDPKTETSASDFYILTHQEMGDEQMKINKMEKWERIKGVDNIPLSHLEKYKNKWDTLLQTINAEEV